MSDSLIMVDSKTLLIGALAPDFPRALRNGVVVSREQLETAAKLLQEAEPSQIAGYKPVERSGFIDKRMQQGDEILVFEVGILGHRHRIARDGTVL